MYRELKHKGRKQTPHINNHPNITSLASSLLLLLPLLSLHFTFTFSLTAFFLSFFESYSRLDIHSSSRGGGGNLGRGGFILNTLIKPCTPNSCYYFNILKSQSSSKNLHPLSPHLQLQTAKPFS